MTAPTISEVEARELVEAICKELGTSLRHYMPTTQYHATYAAQQFISARYGDCDERGGGNGSV
jgi:hypothetical protein